MFHLAYGNLTLTKNISLRMNDDAFDSFYLNFDDVALLIYSGVYPFGSFGPKG
jgi:hypothetical protein